MAEKLRRRLRASLLHALTRSTAVLPERAVEGALAGVSSLARFSRFERLALANLELALGLETTSAERRAIARGVRRHAARQLAEWIRLARAAHDREGTGRWIERTVVLDPSIEILERELARGRGALVVTAHVGNWELLAARLRRHGIEGSVVGFERPNDSGHDWLVALRRGYGVGTIAQSASPRAILRELGAGRVVGLLADLEVRRLAGEFVPFFGVPALTMTAPAALARAARLPLVPVRCLREEQGTYRLVVEPPLELARALDRRASTHDLSARLNALFERWIRLAPEQWAWHQPRWRTRPGELDATPLHGRRRRSASAGVDASAAEGRAGRPAS